MELFCWNCWPLVSHRWCKRSFMHLIFKLLVEVKRVQNWDSTISTFLCRHPVFTASNWMSDDWMTCCLEQISILALIPWFIDASFYCLAPKDTPSSKSKWIIHPMFKMIPIHYRAKLMAPLYLNTNLFSFLFFLFLSSDAKELGLCAVTVCSLKLGGKRTSDQIIFPLKTTHDHVDSCSVDRLLCVYHKFSMKFTVKST